MPSHLTDMRHCIPKEAAQAKGKTHAHRAHHRELSAKAGWRYPYAGDAAGALAAPWAPCAGAWTPWRTKALRGRARDRRARRALAVLPGAASALSLADVRTPA